MLSGFLGPPSASGQGLCCFNRGRSLVVKSRVKIWRLLLCCKGPAKLLTRYFTTRDCPLFKPHNPCPLLALGGPRNSETMESLIVEVELRDRYTLYVAQTEACVNSLPNLAPPAGHEIIG